MMTMTTMISRLSLPFLYPSSKPLFFAEVSTRCSLRFLRMGSGSRDDHKHPTDQTQSPSSAFTSTVIEIKDPERENLHERCSHPGMIAVFSREELRGALKAENSTTSGRFELIPIAQESIEEEEINEKDYKFNNPYLINHLIEKKGTPTDLARVLFDMIKIRGPINVSTYIRECLTNPRFGYYIKKDPFGIQGDFVTAPEISQMFGESIGLWVVNEWERMGKPEKLQLVELGPGRGTLARDLLSICSQLIPDAAHKIAYHFVEASPTLRKTQGERLGCTVDPESLLSFSTIVPQTPSSLGFQISWSSSIHILPEDVTPPSLVVVDSSVFPKKAPPNTPVTPVIFIGQEFLDALPIHRFEFDGKQWRELLVNIDLDPSTPHFFCYNMSPSPTIASQAIIQRDSTNFPTKGDQLEAGMESLALCDYIASVLKKRTGSALLIDYGKEEPLANSLRAIRNHKFENIFANPGNADISAFVDFGSIRYNIKHGKNEKIRDVKVFGSTTQGDFLKELGIESRFAQLLFNSQENQEMTEQLCSSLSRLLDKEEMGSSYRVLSFSHGFPERPLGFARVES